MSVVPKIIKSRENRINRSKSRFIHRIKRLALVIGIIASLVISISIIIVTFAVSKLSQNLPSPEILPLLLEPQSGNLLEPTRLFDRRGEQVIAVLAFNDPSVNEYLAFDEKTLKNIPPSLVNATIVASDPEFRTHQGFSWDLNQLENHPTLAQKLVVDNLLWDRQPSFQTAFTERLLAAQITTRFGQEKILEWFINSTKYGDFVYGADAAARTYFKKSATKLSIAESAALAAAAHFSNLNILNSPQATVDAKNSVLRLMLDKDMITPLEYAEAIDEELSLHQVDEFYIDKSPIFTRLVLEQAGEFIPLERIMKGGLQITTTLDFDIQSQSECTLETHIHRITNQRQNEADLTYCDMARLLPTRQMNDIPTGYSASANIVVLDPRNGQILSIAESDQSREASSQLSNHSPGSILTPFIYLTSFTQGMSPGTMAWDTPAALPDGFSEIQNPDKKFHGPVSLRTSLANDYYIPAIQILNQVDPIQVWRTSQQLGLRSLEIPSGEGSYLLPLDGGQASLLELSQAYGVFANEGILAGISKEGSFTENSSSPILPQAVLKIIESLGEEVLNCSSQMTDCPIVKRPVISPQLAYLITNSLSDEPARWPSLGHPNHLEIGRPAAAKIGRSANGHESWTIGFTPELLVGVWTGVQGPDEETYNLEDISAGLWHAIIQYASRERQVLKFTMPPGISVIKVCEPSGLLPTDECPHLVDEVFTFGNEPTQEDNLYQTFLINRESQQLATIYTPPELVEEKVYMIVPPDQEAWANEANLPTIPKTYDILESITPPTKDVNISSPTMFNVVKGTVPVIGRAIGENFNHYRLQFGSGLNPEAWLQIGEDHNEPVQNGVLGIWDTSRLNGLYALQLIVVYEEQHVETTIIQLTVDNQPPEVSIRFPIDGQKYSIEDYSEITFQAEASDNLDLSSAEFLLDGDSLAKVFTPPFAIPWKVLPGEHVLQVKALDRAGNSSSGSLEFEIDG